MKKRILVTGATGQLGSELKDVLIEGPKQELFFMDRKALPLDQPAIIQDILAMYQPDIIVHAGAYTAVDLAETESDLAHTINYLATEQIAEYAALQQVKLIVISTDYVFDGNSSTPLREDAAVNPINVYGLSKWKGEQIVQHLCPDALIIRTSWVYSKYGKNFVKTMLHLLAEKSEIGVVNDQIGSPTAAKDLAQVIAQIIARPDWIPGLYHYSNEGEISWYDFATAIRDIRGLACRVKPVSSADFPTAAKRPRYSLLDKSRIKSNFDIQVPAWRTSLQEVLQQMDHQE